MQQTAPQQNQVVMLKQQHSTCGVRGKAVSLAIMDTTRHILCFPAQYQPTTPQNLGVPEVPGASTEMLKVLFLIQLQKRERMFHNFLVCSVLQG